MTHLGVKLAFRRTFLSARHLIAGLYPDAATSVPIEFDSYSKAAESESLLVRNPDCPKLQSLVQQTQARPELDQLRDEMADLLTLARRRRVSSGTSSLAEMYRRHPKLLPEHPKNEGFFGIADYFFCRSCHMPRKVGRLNQDDQILSDRFLQVSLDGWRTLQAILEQDPLHSRLRSGPLVTDIFNLLELQPSRNSTAGRHGQLAVFGAHDTTIAYLHAALKTRVREWPPYASNLIFELWRPLPPPAGQSAAFVRAIYNGAVVQFSWATRHSDGLVSWAEFRAYCDHLIPADHRSECQLYSTI